jgi:hypothetical protein
MVLMTLCKVPNTFILIVAKIFILSADFHKRQQYQISRKSVRSQPRWYKRTGKIKTACTLRGYASTPSKPEVRQGNTLIYLKQHTVSAKMNCESNTARISFVNPSDFKTTSYTNGTGSCCVAVCQLSTDNRTIQTTHYVEGPGFQGYDAMRIPTDLEQSTTVAYRGGGSTPPPRNSEGPPKSCQTQPDCENC